MRCAGCGRENPFGNSVCRHCGKGMINSNPNTRLFSYLLSCICPPIGLSISMAYDKALAPEDKRFGRNCLVSVYIGFGIYIGVAVYKLSELGVL